MGYAYWVCHFHQSISTIVGKDIRDGAVVMVHISVNVAALRFPACFVFRAWCSISPFPMSKSRWP